MSGIDLKKAFAFAWSSFKGNLPFYILGLLIALLAFSTLFGIVAAPLKAVSWLLHFLFQGVAGWIDSLVALIAFALKCLVFAPLFVGFLKGIKKEADEPGEKASVADLFLGFQGYLSTVVFSAVMMVMLYIAASIGAALLPWLSFLPVLLLCPVLSLGLYYLAEGCSGSLGLEAIIKAFKNWSLLLELMIIIAMMASIAVGFAICCVGLLATVPLGIATCWHLCRQHDQGPGPSLKGEQAEIGTPS